MRTNALLTSTFVCALVIATAVPAAGADGETTATVTITGGSLSITAPATAGSLGARANTVEAGTISGKLGLVQVNDARSPAAGSGWIVSVISTAFTPPAGPTIGAAMVGYTVGTITKVGTMTNTANNPVALDGNVPCVTTTGITGDNSASWNPTITINIPGGKAAGVYSGTITHSVL